MIFSRRPTSQPIPAVRPANNPLTAGLTGLWNLSAATPQNAVTGEQSVVQVAANCVLSPAQAGLGLRANDGTSKMLQLAASRLTLQPTARDQVTIAILTKLEGGTERATVFSSRWATGGNDDDGWAWDPNLLNVIQRFQHGTGSYTISARSSDARPILRIFSAGPDGFWWSEDGVIQSTSGTAAVAITSADKPFFLGGSGADSINSWPQHTFALAVWKVAKPQSFAQQLGRNIWQLFAPSTRRLLGPSAGAGGVTGTLASANANDTLAASGTTTIAGALARTNGNDTLSAAGTTTLLGTLARTNGNDTLVAVGTTTVLGSFARTSANDALAAAGTTAVLGALSRTSANDTLSASGSIGSAVSGTLAATNASDTLTASGTTAVLGSTVRTNANDTLAASGSPGSAVSGSLARTNANDTLAAAGTTTIIGSLVRTHGSDTLSASGWTTVTGTLARSNASDALSAAGWVGAITGALARTNANDTLVASGSAGSATVEAKLFIALRDLVSARVYPDFAPSNVVRPYIVYQAVGGTAPIFLERAVPSKQNGRFQLTAWAATRMQAAALGIQIEAAMVAATAFQAKPLSAPIALFDEDTLLRGSAQDFTVWSDR